MPWTCNLAKETGVYHERWRGATLQLQNEGRPECSVTRAEDLRVRLSPDSKSKARCVYPPDYYARFSRT